MSIDRERIRDAVLGIPGEAGWWHADGADTFEALAVEMIGHGIPEQAAIDALGRAYGAVANEYGE